MACAILIGLASEAISGDVGNKERICDGTERHVQCHWSGGGLSDYDLGAHETVTYSHPAVAFSFRGTVHIIATPCEITCTP